jgi:tripartite-type tricarboxylate transporter receptor subunit TctC
MSKGDDVQLHNISKLIIGIVAISAWTSGSTALAATPSRNFNEKSVREFYNGKTLKFVVGFSPGGQYDLVPRIMTRYLSKYLPGNPNIIVENRPGGGSLIAANLVYKVLPQDGTHIATFTPQVVFQQLLRQPGVEFDGNHFNWVGSLSQGRNACGVHRDIGVTHVKQITRPNGRVVVIGADAPGSSTADGAAIMRAALGLQFRIIYGYSGGAPIVNAIEQREVDGMCLPWNSWRAQYKRLFEPQRLVNMLVISGSSVPNDPWLKTAEPADQLPSTDDARELLKIADAPSTMTFPYAVGPKVPEDRVAALRSAFDMMASDPAFVADYAKTGLDRIVRSGEEVSQIVKQMLQAKSGTVEALKEALKSREGP